MERKGSGIPGRKQSNLANFSATEEECTRTDFPQYFSNCLLNERLKMPGTGESLGIFSYLV